MNKETLKQIIQKEGDYKAGTYKGYKWRILRMNRQRSLEEDFCRVHLCGYVGLEKTHKYYGKDYNYISVDVHGGLTYANKRLMMQPEKDLYWIGFDCAHAGDLCYVDGETLGFRGDTYKTMEYVQKEIKKLINQLHKLNE